jgi:hypothetical protein
MSSMEQPTKRRKHLIDPSAPPKPRNLEAEHKSLSRVQRWVMSALAVTTLAHLCAGLILAAIFLDNPRPGAEIGLNVIAGAFGVIAVAVALAIHKKPVLSPWLLLGTIPTFVGLWLTFS